MNIFTFADIINAQFVIRRYSNQHNRWIAHFEDCEVKEGPILSSTYGEGNTANEAIFSYVDKIRNQTIVMYAYSEKRKEFRVPDNLMMG